MSDQNDERSGAAVAPDLDENARVAARARLMAAGPQPADPDSLTSARLQNILAMKQDVEQPREAPDLREKIAEVRDGMLERDLVDDPDEELPTADQAYSSMELMLAVAQAPKPKIGSKDVPRLAEELGVAQFLVTVRGLTDSEHEELQEKALREPTKSEKERGAMGVVQDSRYLNRLTLAKAMIDPNPRNVRMKKAYGPTATEVVRKWFSPGEIAMLVDYVMELSGFGGGAVVAPKNS